MVMPSFFQLIMPTLRTEESLLMGFINVSFKLTKKGVNDTNRVFFGDKIVQCFRKSIGKIKRHFS